MSDPIIDSTIANGFHIDPNTNAATLSKEEKARFALSVNPSFRKIDLGSPRILAPATALFTTSQLLTSEECDEWIKRAQTTGLETGDFIFKTGEKGYEKMTTGGRRFSSTTVVSDDESSFNRQVYEILLKDGIVPTTLADGAEVFAGIRNNFLLSRYEPHQYFAPHFDGQQKLEDGSGVSHYTAVLYLSDDFTGGETLYLSSPEDVAGLTKEDPMWSDIPENIAISPKRGHAVVHKQGTVLHAGAEVLSGTKFIIQFSLIYKSIKEENTRTKELPPLRWGA